MYFPEILPKKHGVWFRVISEDHTPDIYMAQDLLSPRTVAELFAYHGKSNMSQF